MVKGIRDEGVCQGRDTLGLAGLLRWDWVPGVRLPDREQARAGECVTLMRRICAVYLETTFCAKTRPLGGWGTLGTGDPLWSKGHVRRPPMVITRVHPGFCTGLYIHVMRMDAPFR